MDWSKLKQVDFPKEQYVSRETKKKQIVLHHTVSGDGIEGDVSSWLATKQRIATCIIVGRDGIMYQCFSSRYWGYHLGVKASQFAEFGLPYDLLDDNAIGVEIDSYGGLVKKGNKWYNVYGGVVDSRKVIEYPEGYRGYFGFEKYNDKQIQVIEETLRYWGERYDIDLQYHENMFEYNKDALKGTEGVWSHSSFRQDKSDVHPQPELIQMLKSL